MILTTEITKIQESLKQIYSVEEYNKIITKVNEQFNGDLEFLAYLAEDHEQDHVLRLFAVAAMGDWSRAPSHATPR